MPETPSFFRRLLARWRLPRLGLPRLPRLYGWALVTVLLLLIAWALAPWRIPLAGWKIVLVTGGAVLGYWLDRGLFSYARPGDLYGSYRVNTVLADKQQLLLAASLAGLRRAIIVFACIIGLTMGM